jgi:hypothetical protein
VAFRPRQNPEAPSPIFEGVLGITRTKRLSEPKKFSIFEIGYPAAIETNRCESSMKGAISYRTVSMTYGFTARNIIYNSSARALLSYVVLTPNLDDM